LVRVRTISAPDDKDLMLTVGTRENLHNVRRHEMSTQRSQPSSRQLIGASTEHPKNKNAASPKESGVLFDRDT
jgi:hypothetical protein